MDERRARQPPPKKLDEIPEHVRHWLNTIDEEDIARFRKWNNFIVWFETSSRYTRAVVLFLMAGFGLYTAAMQLLGRWFGKTN